MDKPKSILASQAIDSLVNSLNLNDINSLFKTIYSSAIGDLIYGNSRTLMEREFLQGLDLLSNDVSIKIRHKFEVDNSNLKQIRDQLFDEEI